MKSPPPLHLLEQYHEKLCADTTELSLMQMQMALMCQGSFPSMQRAMQLMVQEAQTEQLRTDTAIQMLKQGSPVENAIQAAFGPLN